MAGSRAPALAPEVARVAPSGRLDARVAGDFRERLHAAATAGNVVVDLADVDFVDAVALGVLLGSRRRAGRVGHKIVVVGASPAVRRQFARARLAHLLAEH